MKSTNTPEYKAIIEKMIAARKTKKLSQAALADLLGKHQSYIAKIEIGERRIDIIELLEIAKLIDLKLNLNKLNDNSSEVKGIVDLS